MRFAITVVALTLVLLLLSAGFGRWRLSAEALHPSTVTGQTRIGPEQVEEVWQRWKAADWPDAGTLVEDVGFAGTAWTGRRVSKSTETEILLIEEVQVGWPFSVLHGAALIESTRAPSGGGSATARGGFLIGETVVPLVPIRSVTALASWAIAAIAAWAICRGVAFVLGRSSGRSAPR